MNEVCFGKRSDGLDVFYKFYSKAEGVPDGRVRRRCVESGIDHYSCGLVHGS